MNFFDAQDRARRATRWLVVVYLVATILIVAGVTAVITGALYSSGGTHNAPPSEVVLGIAVFATLLIFGATLYKTGILSCYCLHGHLGKQQVIA